MRQEAALQAMATGPVERLMARVAQLETERQGLADARDDHSKKLGELSRRTKRGFVVLSVLYVIGFILAMTWIVGGAEPSGTGSAGALRVDQQCASAMVGRWRWDQRTVDEYRADGSAVAPTWPGGGGSWKIRTYLEASKAGVFEVITLTSTELHLLDSRTNQVLKAVRDR